MEPPIPQDLWAEPLIASHRTRPAYEAIVVGLGAAGGQAAYTLSTEGMKGLLVEAGRNYDLVTGTPMVHSPAKYVVEIVEARAGKPGSGTIYYVIASPAMPGVAIQLDGLLRVWLERDTRNDKLYHCRKPSRTPVIDGAERIRLRGDVKHEVGAR